MRIIERFTLCHVKVEIGVEDFSIFDFQNFEV